MKIFVGGPDYNDTFTHNVAFTLRAMGHEVHTDPRERAVMRRSVIGRGVDEILNKASNRWRTRADRRAVETARGFKPDLTIVCTITLEPESVEAIRKLSGGPVICWYGDSPANLRRDHIVSGEYDAVFAKDPDFVRSLRAMLGIDAHHLVEACNPEWHRPVAERDGDAIVIAGTSYGYRNAMVRRLLDAGQEVRVFGPAPGFWARPEVVRAHTRRFLDEKSKADAFGKAMACLNSFSPAERPNSTNCRIFETCGCGGLLVTEEREAIEAYFEPGVEYLAYSDFDGCLEHLDRVRRDDAFSRGIRERAVRRAHSEHTYRHRLERILETLGIG